MTEWLLVLAGIALTLGTALFVAAEFALVALDRPSVEKAIERGDVRARSVLTSLRALSTQLSASQVGITLTTLVLGFLANPSIGKLLLGPLQSLGLDEALAERVSSVLALFLATIFSMIIGEMVPKTLAISTPLATAKWVAGPVRWFALAFKPFIHVLNGTANSALRAMGVEPQEELSAARSPAELASLVRTSAEAGTLDLGTARLVTASLTFGVQTAADVMTPRSRATAIDRSASARECVELARQTGHSRFPVIDDDWDDVDGVVHVKKAIAVPHERRDDVPVSALMTPPLVVPESIRLDPLLIHLRDSGQQFAIVVDEYGGTSGVVTLEDLVEEIVGEVSDEHDRSQTTGRQMTDGSWTVPGLWRPDEVKRRTGIEIPEGPAYETVAGFLMSELGRVPEVGDVVELPGWRITVVDMESRRVDRLRFTSVPVEGDAPTYSPDEEEGAPA
ncbi:hemolysin family protein [Knoellia sp. S7-12]|uniref:hemolysin family protein n=1 Tax=Knoellia sp. S7-12 TaxID=3126698 RepID=UPI003368D53D